MAAAEFKVLAINPGSTSTKFGIFVGDRAEKIWTLRHSEEEIAGFKGRSVLAQESFRHGLIEGELKRYGLNLKEISAVVGRGGRLRPMESGTYRVNREMLDELRAAPWGEHASNLGAILAYTFAQSAGVDAFIVDPISVNERIAKARLSGSAELPRGLYCHALNSKATAKRYAREQKRPYADMSLVVAHMGGGVCLSAHEGGKMVDVTDSMEEGPFASERTGSVPVYQLAQLCFSGKYSKRQIERLLFGEGGIYSYLGTTDLIEVERRIAAGDAKAALVFDALAYQIVKEIGAMAAVLAGRCDAILLTGGMAYSKKLVGVLTDAVKWIAPVCVYPGEEELQALTEGALRVLRKEEPPRELEGSYKQFMA